MGYLHINNLYKAQEVLLFKEVFALEKVHGSSASITWTKENELKFFAGGEKHERFLKLFDQEKLKTVLSQIGQMLEIVIYGEVYGGKCQGMSDTYGKDLAFIAFDVTIDDCWLSVPQAEKVVKELGLEFVPYEKVDATLAKLDELRDSPSVVAIRRLGDLGRGKQREGIVIRPLIEVTMNNGGRVIAKHKGEHFRERATFQNVTNPAKLKILEEAKAIADEWVTDMRLEHVLQKFPRDIGIESMRQVLAAMVEDVTREAKGEIVDSPEARKAICYATSKIFQKHVQKRLREREI